MSDGKWITVVAGQCLSQIGYDNGIPWRKIWDHSNNEHLQKRGDPNILKIGDKVFVPTLEGGEESASDGEKQTYRKPGRTELRVCVRDVFHQPAADVEYYFVVNGENTDVQHTGADGVAEVTLPSPDAEAVLVLPWGAIELNQGVLEPANTITGIQQRLHNLAIECGPVDGLFGPLTSGGVREFQAAESEAGLKATGDPDPDTVKRLRELHDGICLEGEANEIEKEEPQSCSASDGEVDELISTEEELSSSAHDYPVCEDPRYAAIAEFIESNGIVPRDSWAKMEPDSGNMSMATVDYHNVVIHHSGDWGHTVPHKVEKMHRDKNYGDVGYNFLITPDGTIHEGRHLTYLGAHVYGNNPGRIGILVMGDFEPQWYDLDDEPTDEQIAATKKLVNALRVLYPTITSLGGHRDYDDKNPTVCPGEILYKKLDEIRTATGLSGP